MYTLEICAANLQSALNAQAAGAGRIELCDNLWEGGTTPSAGLIKMVRKKLDIDLFVLIRPRGGDFLYSDEEFEVICEDIRIAKDLGADGIVSAVLNADGTIDKDRTALLVKLAYPLPFSFHRAFDCTAHLPDALEDLIESGVTRVLTSAGANSVLEGLDMLRALQLQANNRIIILPGGGIRPHNILQIAKVSGCREFHLSAKAALFSNMTFKKPELRMNGSLDIAEDCVFVSEQRQIAAVIQALQQIK